MRNLKKFLCLALALTMALSLVVLPTAQAANKNLTNFPDAADVAAENKEAIDVLVAIGVVTGDVIDGKTVINPKGDYNRAQAAALMARYMMGSTLADNLSDAVSPFDDVPAGHWAAGEINYCKNANIINGMGDGTFNPGGDVTAAAMLKMLLVASGYGANGEFVGDSWQINAIKGAVDAGIISRSTTDDLSLPVPRQTIFKYTFTTLTDVSLVKWNQFVGYMDINGTITEPKLAKNDRNRLTQGGEVFLLEKDETGTNEFGVPVRVWKVNNQALTLSQTSFNPGSIIATFNGSKTKVSLYNDYKWNLEPKGEDGKVNKNLDALEIIRNGSSITLTAAELTEGRAARAEVPAVPASGTTLAEATKTAIIGQPAVILKTDTSNPQQTSFDANASAKVTLYDTNNDGTVDVVSIRDEFLARVTALASGTATLAVYMDPNPGATPVVGTISNATGIAVNDYIYVVPTRDPGLSWNGAYAVQPDYITTFQTTYQVADYCGTNVSIATNAGKILDYGKADIKEGALDRVAALDLSFLGFGIILDAAPTAITLSGGSALTLAPAGFATLTQTARTMTAGSDSWLGKEVVAYMSTNGFVLGFDRKTGSSDFTGLDYLYLTKFAATNDIWNGVRTTAQVVLTDGSVKTISIATTTANVGGATVDQARIPDKDSVTGANLTIAKETNIPATDKYDGWYSYSVDDSGKYTLRNPDASVGTGILQFSPRSAGGVNPGFTVGTASSLVGWTSTANTQLVVSGQTRTGFANFAIDASKTYGDPDSGTKTAVLVVPAPNTTGNVAARIYIVAAADDGSDFGAKSNLGIITAVDSSFTAAGTYTITVSYLEGGARKSVVLTRNMSDFTADAYAAGNIVAWKDNATGEDTAEKQTTVSGVVIGSGPGYVTVAVGFAAAVEYPQWPWLNQPKNWGTPVDVYFTAANTIIVDGTYALGTVTDTTAITIGATVTFVGKAPSGTTPVVEYSADAMYINLPSFVPVAASELPPASAPRGVQYTPPPVPVA